MAFGVHRFVFLKGEDWQRFAAFMKEHLAPLAAQERHLQAVVSEYKTSRTKEQNAYMWTAILEPIAQQVVQAGTHYAAEVWNEYLKREHLPEQCAKGVVKWSYLPDGTRHLTMSTSDLNHAEMNEYLTAIAAHAATELGVHLPVNPRDL